MDVSELEVLLEVGGDLKISLEQLQQLVSRESLNNLRVIYEILEGNVKETSYVVLLSRFYEPQSKTLELLTTAIPRTARNIKFTKEFYENSKRAYEKRCRYNITHNPSLLMNEIDDNTRYTGYKGKCGPGLMPSPRASGRARKH